MKTIVAGTRSYKNKKAVFSILSRCPWKITEVVSGVCKGPDLFGEEWAKQNKIKVEPFPYPSEHGLSGGPIRNYEMAQYADACIVFLDSKVKSNGSRNMIDNALNLNLHLLVVQV